MIHFVIMAQDKIKMHDSASHTTEKDENTELLKEKLLKVNSVLAAHQIALWEININTLECTFTQEYFESLGLDKVGIRYQNLEEFCSFVHPDDKHLVSLDGFQKKLDGFEESKVLRVRCVGAHGEIVWLEDHLLSVEKDRSGNPESLLCYTVNVTGQCERETRISRMEERNRKIIQALPEFIFIFDENFFLTDVLMSSDTILLHPVEQLRGADGRTIYSPEVSDLFLRNIRQCLEDGELKEIEYPLDVDDCERHYFQARIAPFEDNKVMALIHDIGDRVQRSNELIEAKQRAEEADRMKSVFLANMSHEIRTPLNAIVGFSKLVADADSPEEKQLFADIIDSNSELLLQLINDILDISKIEAGTLEFNFRTMDLGLLCQEQYEIHKTRVREGVRLVLDDHAGSVELIGDHNRLAQVYTNLIGNAIKFTHQGEIRFGYRVEGDRIVGYVSDTGVGIPADKVGAVFDRFIKLNDFAAGTGLGLSITKMIIEKMGGGIEVSSREGEGTTFRFTIPYSRPDTEGPGKAADGARRHAQRATEAVEGKRILVAEDIDSNFMLIDALIGRRFDLLRARNGEEAVALFGRERPDLVLMDLKMPVMDGYEATRLIRAEAPTAPLVVMSAFAYEGDIERAYEAGCTDYVTKPVSRKRLMEVIERYLG